MDETLTSNIEGQDIVCACMKVQEVHKRTVQEVAFLYERQTPNRMATYVAGGFFENFHIFNYVVLLLIELDSIVCYN